MNKETKLQREILIAISKQGHTAWRNETAQFWTGQVIHKQSRMVTLKNAKMIPVGLCVGSSDIIGLTKEGRFFALEVKTLTGKASDEQIKFINHVKKQNGIAGIVRSVDDALKLLAQ